MNLIEAEVTNGHLTAAGDLQIKAPEGLQRGQKVIAGVRPEGLAISQSDDGRPRAHRLQEALGDETIYVVECEAGLIHVRMPATARFDEEQVVSPCAIIGAAPPVYDPTTEKVVSP